jgi:hypothetical protein
MEVCKPTKVTRKQLVEDFNLRPGTVSAFALQLINRAIVEEFQPLPAYQKRRIEILSAPWFRTLGHRMRLIFLLAAIMKIFIVI